MTAPVNALKTICPSKVSGLIGKLPSVSLRVRTGDLTAGKLTGASAFQILQRNNAGNLQEMFMFLRGQLKVEPFIDFKDVRLGDSYLNSYPVLTFLRDGNLLPAPTITPDNLIEAIRDDWEGFTAARASPVSPKSKFEEFIQILKAAGHQRTVFTHGWPDFQDGQSHMDMGMGDFFRPNKPMPPITDFNVNRLQLDGLGAVGADASCHMGVDVISAHSIPPSLFNMRKPFSDPEAVEQLRASIEEFFKNGPILDDFIVAMEESDGAVPDAGDAAKMVLWNGIGGGSPVDADGDRVGGEPFNPVLDQGQDGLAEFRAGLRPE